MLSFVAVGYTDSRCLYHPNECLESFQYKITAFSESSTVSGYHSGREVKMEMEIELIPQNGGQQWLS